MKLIALAMLVYNVEDLCGKSIIIGIKSNIQGYRISYR